MTSPQRNVFIIPLLISIVSMIIFVLAVLYSWMGVPEGVGGSFCEIGDGIIKQPANTVSNVGFIAVGLLIGWKQSKGHYHHHSNILTKSPFVSGFFATLGVLLGPGSMAMHATTTRVGGFLDMLSMYMMAAFVFSFAVSRLFRWQGIGFFLSFLFAFSVQLYVHTLPYDVPFVGFIGSFGFGVTLIVSTFIELFTYFFRNIKIDIRYGLASVLVLCLAFFIWNMSLTDGPWCDPSSLIQGHGAWHLLCAFAVYLLYKFYVSEQQEVL